MIELSSLLPTAPVAPGRPQLLAATSAGSFAVALNAVAVPDGLTLPVGGVALPERQVVAGSGKNLPDVAESAPDVAPISGDVVALQLEAGDIGEAPTDAPTPATTDVEQAVAEPAEFSTNHLIAAKPGRAKAKPVVPAEQGAADPLATPADKPAIEAAPKSRAHRKQVADALPADAPPRTEQAEVAPQPLTLAVKGEPEATAPQPQPETIQAETSKVTPPVASQPAPLADDVPTTPRPSDTTLPAPVIVAAAASPSSVDVRETKGASKDKRLSDVTPSQPRKSRAATPDAVPVAADPTAAPSPEGAEAAPTKPRKASQTATTEARPAPAPADPTLPADAATLPPIPVAANDAVVVVDTQRAPVQSNDRALPTAATPRPVRAAPKMSAVTQVDPTLAPPPAATIPGPASPPAPASIAPGATAVAQPPVPPLADEQIIATLRPVVLDAPAASPVPPAVVPPFSAAPAPAMAQAALEGAPALFQLALDPAPRRFRLADTAPVTLLTPAQAATMPPLIPLAAADNQPPLLDTGRQEWTGQMIEMIQAMQDEMQDAAPVKETRMRLAPEALGRVDITVRQDGDRVHVHFAADTPAARQMLADAQPRLAEIAEQRGLKLGQTSVEGGAAGQGQHSQRHDGEARHPGRPASARSRDDTERKPTLTDERIA